jgi:spermidine synthase
VSVLRTFTEAGQHLALRKHRGALELVLGNVVLLSSAALETERAFGALAGGGIAERSRPRILIGGLGFGSTARGVLDVVPAEAEIVVVEKLEAVIDIVRNEGKELAAGVLDDPRIRLEHADVADVIESSTDVSAILLDVDNGPQWASFRTNAKLYSEAALVRARDALAPGGIYAVWSGYPADAFVGKLRRAGFAPHIAPLTERGVVKS